MDGIVGSPRSRRNGRSRWRPKRTPHCTSRAFCSLSTSPMRVTLFIPCFVDAFYPRVGISVVTVLERLGHTVECPEEIACCGQPAFNSGYWEEAREVAVKVLKTL